mgnify:CR=1 FL=1
MLYHLNIGSNVGDRLANIDRAIAALGRHVKVLAVSEPVRSAPWGFDSPNEFINVGVNVDCDDTPLRLLDVTQAVQREIDPSPHRDEQGNYVDRVIDVDIIAAGSLIVTSRRLTVPHRCMTGRRFVLEPLAALCPEWVHPVWQLTASEMIARLT